MESIQTNSSLSCSYQAGKTLCQRSSHPPWPSLRSTGAGGVTPSLVLEVLLTGGKWVPLVLGSLYADSQLHLRATVGHLHAGAVPAGDTRHAGHCIQKASQVPEDKTCNLAFYRINICTAACSVGVGSVTPLQRLPLFCFIVQKLKLRWI